MAITSIWGIKGRVAQLLDYAEDAEKTEDGKLRREVTTCDEVKERAKAVRAKLQRIYDDNYRGTQRERNREYQYER